MTLLETSLQQTYTQLTAEQIGILRPRYQAHAPVLFESLHKLYGDREDFDKWFAHLLTTMARLHANRSAALRALDQQRANTPDWFASQNMLGYCAYVDRFAGRLKGVSEKIQHLSELGVTYLHLLPFLRARAGDNDGGFAVADYDEIEPRLGSMQDLQELTENLRAAGISLCSDFVLNHVADDHLWALAAKSGSKQALGYFHTFADRQMPDAFERSLGQIFPQAAPGNFTFSQELQRWVWTTFYPYQWDLNYGNPAVFAEMVSALLKLANRGVEVFRLDSTAFLWKREGGNCMNQPEAHWILQAMRSIVDIVAPGVLLKAEAIVATAELPAYLGNEERKIRECHLAYHSSLMAAAWTGVAEQSTDLLYKVMQATPTLPAQATWLTYVRCHDDIGWNVLRPEASLGGDNAQRRLAQVSRFFSGEAASFARGASFQASDPASVHGSNGMSSALTGFATAKTLQESVLAQRRMLLLYGLAFCFGGLPLVYMGDELAQANDETYMDDPARKSDGRWLQRPVLDEEAFNARHDRTSSAGRLFASMSYMSQCRRKLPALAATEPRTLIYTGHQEILAFLRGVHSASGHGSSLLFIGNFSDRPIDLNLGALAEAYLGDVWQDRLSKQNFGSELTIEPWGQVWLVPARQVLEANRKAMEKMEPVHGIG